MFKRPKLSLFLIANYNDDILCHIDLDSTDNENVKQIDIWSIGFDNNLKAFHSSECACHQISAL